MGSEIKQGFAHNLTLGFGSQWLGTTATHTHPVIWNGIWNGTWNGLLQDATQWRGKEDGVRYSVFTIRHD